MSEERSTCGSGGCVTCPFSFNEESEIVHNYACLPTSFDIIKLKETSGHNWSCHGDETVMCGGYAKHIKEHRADLSIKDGNLISFTTWYQEGEEIAIEKANKEKR